MNTDNQETKPEAGRAKIPACCAECKSFEFVAGTRLPEYTCAKNHWHRRTSIKIVHENIDCGDFKKAT